MKKQIMILLALAGPVSLVIAQSNEAIKKLNDSGVTLEQIENSLKDADANFYFKATTTSVSAAVEGEEYQTVEVSEFDPRREIGERWKLLSKNGEIPTAEDIKSFNKSTNTKKKDVNGKIDPETVRVLDENENTLVVGFRYQGKTLPRKYQFLADCDGKFTIDKQNQKILSGEFKNFRPTKFSIMKVPELDMQMEFIFLDEADGYHIKSEHLDLTARMLGAEVKSSTVLEYSDFEKVK